MDFEYDGIEHVLPEDIEKNSFEIITKELEEKKIEIENENAFVIKRCIHTSADFDYAKNLCFSTNAVSKAIEILKSGNAVIVTDTNMALSGISKIACKKLGVEAFCFMADEDVAAEAKKNGTTRAVCCIDKALKLYGNCEKKLIFAIGNAPTALVRIRELYDKNILNPDFIIAVPVGFVNVVRAKELIIEMKNQSYIVAKGRKGGSNIAAAICNALLYSAGGRL